MVSPRVIGKHNNTINFVLFSIQCPSTYRTIEMYFITCSKCEWETFIGTSHPFSHPKERFWVDIGVLSLIQVDIGGHPPFPTGSKQFSGNFGNLLFLAGFNFRGHFEGLNEGFLRSRFSMIVEGIIEPPK
jgi:hypothetical protein